MKPRISRYFHTRASSRRLNLFLSFCAIGAAGLAGTSSAGSFGWDPGHTPATPSGGDGTWNITDANWSDLASDVVWSTTAADDNKALFGATAGTVTLGASFSAGGIQFDTSGYTLSGAFDLTLNPQTTGSDSLVVSAGVSNTTIGLRKLILTASGSGAIGDMVNTDMINFGDTIVAFSGSRQSTLSNSTTTATTTIRNLAIGTGTPGGASIYLNQGNLVITNFSASTSTSALAAANSTATTGNMTFRGTGTGKYTISGNNTLLNNAGTGNLTINFNSSTTYEIGHDNALGARDAGDQATDTGLGFAGGTLVAINGARNIANPLIVQSGNFTIGAGDAFTFSGTYTNSGGSRTLTVNNNSTTLSGPVYLANDDLTARTFTISGTGAATISGAITNNASTNTLASNLTKSGAGTLTLGGANTYTGNTTVNAGSLTLASTGSLKFVVQPAAVSNKVTGGGATVFNGAFNIDVSAAGVPAVGTTWPLVETSSTYGSTFTVAAPFAESAPGSGYWTYSSGGNTWYFSKLSGKLTYGATPERVWDGDSGGAWATGGNWVGGSAPAAGETIVFTGANTTNNNDLDTATAGTVALGGIIFSPAAGAFTLGGNTVNLSGKSISNFSPLAQTLALDVEADTGFTVNTAAGDVALTGSLKTTTGFNKALNKNGAGTLVLNGTQSTSWAMNVNAGTLQVFNTGAPAFSATIAPGATLKAESGDVFHFNLTLTNNGTYDLISSEGFGNLAGSGVVTNHGASPDVVTTISLGNAGGTFAGSIRDGSLGSPTAVTVSDSNTTDTTYPVLTLGGNNTYTGDTTISHQDASFVLASTGSMKFRIGANGVGTRITGVDHSAGSGSVSLKGAINIDLTGAAAANGNSWTLVDVAALNSPTPIFDTATFHVAAPFAKTAEGVWEYQQTSATKWTFSEANGVLSVVSSGGGGNYDSWASDNGIAGQPASGDYDHDGLTNLMEYALGKSPTASSTPAGTYSGNTVTFTKGADAIANGDVSWVIQESDDLGLADPWTAVKTQAAGDPAATISYTLPTGKPKVFVRLVVAK